MSNAVRILPSHIPSVAKSAARRAGLIALPVLIVAGALLVFGVLLIATGGKKSDGHFEKSVLHGMYYLAGFVFLTPYGFAMLLQQRRATLASVKANADPTTIWYLTGFVVAPIQNGAPDPSLSFKVTPKMQMHLTNLARTVPQR